MGETGEGLKRARPQDRITDLHPEDTGLSVVAKKPRLENDGDGAPHSEADPDQIDARVRAHDVDAKTGIDEGHNRIGIDDGANKDGDDAPFNGDKVHPKLDIRGQDTNTGRRRKPPKQATIGPRHFDSSKEMLDYFYHLLNGWPLVLDINKVRFFPLLYCLVFQLV